ncbi:MAG: hypothetical protein H7338_13815 [Candidatus Sericytochromatia bacterium]|nr:hypothetical protein [Candidatus Sericytochromatia bacterium]
MADPAKEIQHRHGQARVTVDVADEDRFSVVVERIRTERIDGVPAAAAAPAVAAGINYLLEPLRLVESGPDEALVRSADAHQDKDGAKRFYELRFQGKDMVMGRQKHIGGETAPEPFTLPRETLDRLVDDLGRMIGRSEPSD